MFDGTNFVVGFFDYYPPQQGYAVLGQRIRASDGALLDTTAAPLTQAYRHASEFALAAGGGQILVGTRAQVRRSNAADLSWIDQTPIPVRLDSPMIAAYADGYFGVVGKQVRGFAIVRVRASDGAVLDMNPDALPLTPWNVDARDAAITTDGTRFAVVWHDLRSYGNDVYARRLRAADGLLDRTDTLVRLTPPGSDVSGRDPRPLVEWDGRSSYLVTWEEYSTATGSAATGSNVRARRLTQALASLDGPADSPGVAVATGPSGEAPVALGAGDGRALAVYTDPGLAGKRIDTATAAVLDAVAIRLTTTANAETHVAAAFGGAHYMLVWLDSRRSGSPSANTGKAPFDLYAARIRASDQAALDSSGIEIARDVSAGLDPHDSNLTPAIGSDGTDFLIVWRSSAGLMAVRIRGADGGAIDPAPFLAQASLYSRATRPAVGYAAGKYLVVWQEQGKVLARRVVAASGGLLDPVPIEIGDSTASYEFVVPRVSCYGGECFVVWTATQYVGGARIRMTDGAVIDVPAASVGPRGFYAGPGVAWVGRKLFVAWGADPEVAGRWIELVGTTTRALQLEAPIAIGADWGSKSGAAVGFDGRRTVVAWRQPGPSRGEDVLAVRVGARGLVDGVLQDAWIWLANDSLSALIQPRPAPAIASEGGGRSLIAYARYHHTAPYRAVRLRVRILNDPTWEDGVCPPDVFSEGCFDAGVGPDASAVSDASVEDGPAGGDAGVAGSDAMEIDAGSIEDAATVSDASPSDAPPSDAPPSDAPPSDAPPSDASPSDASPSDASPSDAGVIDASVRDAGVIDAAGSPADAAAEPDVEEDEDRDRPRASCDCSSAASTTNQAPGVDAVLLSLLAVAVLARRVRPFGSRRSR